MPAKKEHFTGLVKTVKEKVRDWWVSFESRHLWIARLVVYFTCLVVVISVCFILFCYFNLFHTDADSARYMLSALVQSQAAIVAIVITLTLIAVQLTASAYSPRVIDIFKKNPDMWILLGCYGASIFYGFIVLKLVEGVEGEAVSQSVRWSLGQVSISLEYYVSITYWLGAFTFVALFLYMLNIIGLLKSENIIERLKIEITKDKILNSEEDPIQPIMDIVHGSIMKYDLETTRVGLKAVTEQAIKIIETEIIGSDDKEEISVPFCNHLERVGRLAISKLDEESAIEVIENFENFCKSTAERKLKDATREAVKSLGEIGKAAAEKELEEATREAVRSLGEVGKAAVEKGLEVATREAVRSLREIGKAAAKKELEEATKEAAESLEEIVKAVAKKELEGATQFAVRSLGEIGKAAAEKGLEDATRQAAGSLAKVGRGAAEKSLEVTVAQAAESLAELTISSEGVVKNAIQIYESELKGKDRESFQKFKKIYEEELEKLRAEK